MENTENKKPKTLLRVLVIGVIIILLILLSIGIVKIIPRILNSIANASLSVGSLLNTRPDSNNSQTNQNSTSTATSTDDGFSIRDLTNINQTTNNFVPAPGGQSTYATSSISVTAVSNSQNQNSNTGANSNIQSNTTTSGHLSNTNTTTNTQTNSTTNTNSISNSRNTYQNTNSPTKYTVGNSDIAVEVTSVGIIDNNTGNYVATNSFTNEDMVVIKFKIENRGQYATGIWSARVNIPTSDANQVKYLNNNKSLPAGTAITGEARFNNANIGNQTFSVSVDTTQSTKDTNRNNNNIVINLNVSQKYYSNPNPYYQYDNFNYSYPNYNYPNQYYYNNYNYGYGSGYNNQYWYGSNYPIYNCGPYDIYTGQYIGYTNNCNY